MPRTPFALVALAVLAATGAHAAAQEAAPAAARAPELPRVFRRVTEPREQAFTLRLPAAWTLAGGVLRVDPVAAGGPAQSLEAKLELTFGAADGRVRAHRTADWYFCDVSASPAGQLGLYPPGSCYQGMTVWPLPRASDYLTELWFAREHPRATDVRVCERRGLPKLARAAQRRQRAMLLPLAFELDAARVRWTYREDDVAYEEVAFTLIEDRGALAGGQWANRETWSFRAPEGQLAAWGPVFADVLRSVVVSPTWLRGELQGQLERAGIWARVRGEAARLERELAEHRAHTNAEILNDVFLTLTDQEEYLDPFTGETVVGTSELGRWRWQTDGGDVLYSDEETFDPNPGKVLDRSDWKRSPVRPR